MKNFYNIGFVALLLVVLGCNCERFKELADQQKQPPTTTPPVANTTPSPASSPTASKSAKTDLTLDKFNKVKNGMSYKEVVEIIGSEGVQQSSAGEGKYKVETYKWEGEQFQFLTVVFMGEKVYSKIQNGLK